MRMSFVLVIAVLMLSLTASASDPPHWASPATNIDCSSCHTGHSAPGAGLTASASNVNLCQSCHNPSGIAPLMSINTVDISVPGYRGTSHGVDVSQLNSTLGAAAPENILLSKKIFEGNIICSTCHDQHGSSGTAVASGLAGRQTVSAVTHPAGAGTGTFLIDAVDAAAMPRSYLIEITSAGAAGVAKFKLSNDNGVSWWGWNGTLWVAYTASPDNSRLTASTPLDLNDGTNVSVSFSAAGSFVAGDRFYFHVSYPFLRVPLDSGDNATGTKFCRDCHREWAMDHTASETYDGTPRSHPVGIGLNANARGYDRLSPLDGDGSVNDGISSNDLQLDASGNIQCLTCHGVHFADGNTQTEK